MGNEYALGGKIYKIPYDSTHIKIPPFEVAIIKIREILKTFGITNDDLTITEDGTLIKSKQFDSQKLKMILSPFYPLDKMEVIDAYTLKMVDLIIDSLNEDADGSADDLGDTPEEGEGIVGIDDLTQIIDSKFPDVEIVIVSDNKMELPTIDEISKI